MVIAAALALQLVAQPTVEGVEPWTEAVVSVRDIPAATRLFREVGGWRVTHRGAVDRSELDYWQLPPSARARFERLCAPQATTGCIRFVRFDGVPQRPVRLGARAWDTGGIYSIMVRTDNLPALFDAAIARGWWAESEPIRFTFGQSDLRNVVLVGPHGVNLAVYERVSPPFTAFPVGRISQGFNSMRMVREKAAGRSFYRDVLGFGTLFDSNAEPATPAFSNFGIPFNLTPMIRRSAVAMQPSPGETGRIELMQIEGFTGRDLAAHAGPPNLGILSVRYPARDMAALQARFARAGVAPAYQAGSVRVTGIGTAAFVAVRDPDGNLTEFYATSGAR